MSLAERYHDQVVHLPPPEPHPDDDADLVAEVLRAPLPTWAWSDDGSHYMAEAPEMGTLQSLLHQAYGHQGDGGPYGLA